MRQSPPVGIQICRAMGGRTGQLATNRPKCHVTRGRKAVKVLVEVYKILQMKENGGVLHAKSGWGWTEFSKHEKAQVFCI